MKQHFEKNANIRFFSRMFLSVCAAIFLSPVLAMADVRAPSSAAKTTQVELKADPKKVQAELDGVGVKEHLGEKVDIDHLEFILAADGKKHFLKEFFETGKPVLMNLVYFECPMLCTMVVNGLNDGMKQLDWSVGKQFNVITVSINPNDTAEMAKYKRQNYLKSYLESGHDAGMADKGWNFFTGTEDQIKKLADQLGFEYKYDQVQKEYAHPAVTFVLTPTGVVSRYLYGISGRPTDMRLGLLEASQGKIGNVFDRLLMFCYHYEPNSRGYTLQAVRVMQAGGAAMIFLLGGYLAVFWTRQRKGKTS